jgi:DNA-nicking Smr family endonuclease
MVSKTDPDGALWRQAMSGVRPLAPRPSAPPLKPEPAARHNVANPSPPVHHPPLPPLTADRPAGLDRANAERLKRGKHRIEARLDLHGMTQSEAHSALLGFIRGARAEGKRCVLIITGRGAVGAGILRSAVPRWLNEPEFRSHLLAMATAQQRDGGGGALYVMLRRTRMAE